MLEADSSTIGKSLEASAGPLGSVDSNFVSPTDETEMELTPLARVGRLAETQLLDEAGLTPELSDKLSAQWNDMDKRAVDVQYTIKEGLTKRDENFAEKIRDALVQKLNPGPRTALGQKFLSELSELEKDD